MNQQKPRRVICINEEILGELKRDGGLTCSWLKSERENDIWFEGYNQAIKVIKLAGKTVDAEFIENATWKMVGSDKSLMERAESLLSLLAGFEEKELMNEG